MSVASRERERKLKEAEPAFRVQLANRPVQWTDKPPPIHPAVKKVMEELLGPVVEDTAEATIKDILGES